MTFTGFGSRKPDLETEGGSSVRPPHGLLGGRHRGAFPGSIRAA